MFYSRRDIVSRTAAAALVPGLICVSSGLAPTAARGDVTSARLGVLVGDNPTGYLTFEGFLGRKPDLASLAFNQTSAGALSSSVSYICKQGVAFISEGAQILWSVPCPGSRQLEAIVAERYDGLYTLLFKSILAVSPKDATDILVRLPWEFNLAGQQNAAINKYGAWDAPLFIEAWQRLALLAWRVSPRFKRIWCPNVTTCEIDPAECFPTTQYADIVAQDFYMHSGYNKPGDFSWFLGEARGLAWGVDFASYHKMPYGLSEWGMNSDIFAGDLSEAVSWLAGLDNEIQHHCWWNRTDVIDCCISDGIRPELAAAYLKAFA